MNVREWALITFTILAQMSVGSFIVLGIVHYFVGKKAGEKQADELSDRALLAIGPVLALGMVASLLHLGNPLNAYKAVTNLGTSWLSREIFFGVLFAVTGAVFAVMQWKKIATFQIRNLVAILAAIIGIALVYSMAQVYMMPTRPSWNLVTTPISFYATTLLLGVLAMGAAFVANFWYVQSKNPGCASEQCVLLRDSLRWIAIASIVLLGFQFVVLPLSIAFMAASGAAVSAAMFVGEYGALFALRLVLVFLGAGVLGIFVYREAQSAGHERQMSWLAYGAFACVLVGEVVGRFLFYATTTHFGLQ
ncbi:MAG: dimethyl sulfoxide reductase anchor subunit [Chloroflexi bacterium]|nr:dimethyl sulfoxide reductase anchor subunit [Chloroflexota bacterium]